MLRALTIAATLVVALPAQQGTPATPKVDTPKIETAKAAPKLQGQTGKVQIGDLATVDLPKEWVYLPGATGQQFLVDRGNGRNPGVLGVAVDDVAKIFVVFFFNDDGHVKDEDAASIDFKELLAEMQKDVKDGNEGRAKEKLATAELIGWAEPPHYDSTEKKLYYAERLQFSDTQDETLNYFVRVLGRNGVLEMNAVGGMDQLKEVATGSKELLAATAFLPGKRYDEFNPSIDKIAAYGIGGLIAGKLLLKAGLFKVLLKPLLIGGAVLVAFLGKLLGKKPKPATATAGNGRA